MSDPFRIYTPDECGRDDYPLAWHHLANGRGVKHLVREKAGHSCIRCGHPYRVGQSRPEWSPCGKGCTHGEPVRVVDGVTEARYRVLTVHHLLLGTDAKRDLRWWNLVALCQRCHLTIQGKVRMERVWPYEHTEWFKPYAAGWYAWSYLREELSREQVMDRLDELLALELTAPGLF